jgi:hypothetical protein
MHQLVTRYRQAEDPYSDKFQPELFDAEGEEVDSFSPAAL